MISGCSKARSVSNIELKETKAKQWKLILPFRLKDLQDTGGRHGVRGNIGLEKRPVCAKP